MFHKALYNLRYHFKPPWDSGISPPELLEFITYHPSGNAMDCGCGTGTNAITLAKYGWTVTGVDFSYRAISLARRKASKEKLAINFIVDDVTRLTNVNEKFVLILDIGCLHSLSDNELILYIRNLDRLLVDEGVYLMYGFYKNHGISRKGLTVEKIELLTHIFSVVNRQDGFDRGRKSAWFAFKRHNKYSKDI